LARFHSAVPIAIYVIGCAVISMVALVLIPNRAGADHTVEYDEDATMRSARQAQAPS
jgi:hypothetical protein